MAVSNFGTLLKIKILGIFVNIKGVYNVSPIEREQEKLEITHFGQSNSFRQFIPTGVIDPGDYSFDMHFSKADETQQALYALLESGAAGEFQIVYPDGITQEFRAYVTGMTYNEANSEGPEAINITVSLAIFDYTDDSTDIIVELALNADDDWLLSWIGELKVIENDGFYYLYYTGPSTNDAYSIELDGSDYWLIEN